jgi:cation diffusion facilitator CzcD-associated flavoprotein CzcO
MSKAHHRLCIIIGAGASGIIQAADLLRKSVLQPPDLQILERNDGYGGVWNTARYPGAACDVWSHVYQISWHRNPSTLPKARGGLTGGRLDDTVCEWGGNCKVL